MILICVFVDCLCLLFESRAARQLKHNIIKIQIRYFKILPCLALPWKRVKLKLPFNFSDMLFYNQIAILKRLQTMSVFLILYLSWSKDSNQFQCWILQTGLDFGINWNSKTVTTSLIIKFAFLQIRTWLT